jgi:hypothetical protein
MLVAQLSPIATRRLSNESASSKKRTAPSSRARWKQAAMCFAVSPKYFEITAE